MLTVGTNILLVKNKKKVMGQVDIALLHSRDGDE
jgi:hypothetical protein